MPEANDRFFNIYKEEMKRNNNDEVKVDESSQDAESIDELQAIQEVTKTEPKLQ